MNCVACEVEVIPEWIYRQRSPAERVGVKPKRGRGLCSTCYSRHHKAGTLIDFPALTVPRDVMLEDAYMLVMEEGYKRSADVAARMSMTKDALCQALLRAVRAGDERAVAIRERLDWLGAIT